MSMPQDGGVFTLILMHLAQIWLSGKIVNVVWYKHYLLFCGHKVFCQVLAVFCHLRPYYLFINCFSVLGAEFSSMKP